jgi:hypothetical protein
VFNNNPSSTANLISVTIASVRAEYRFIGETEYKAGEGFKLLNTVGDLPVSIDPRQTWTINFQVSVPRTEEDQKNRKGWNRAFVARKRPLRVKLIVEEIEGEEAGLVLDYVFQPYRLEKEEEKDLAFFFFDNPESLERCYVRVEKVEDSGSGLDAGVVKIARNEINVKKLHQVVYKALKTGKTEVDLGIGWQDGEWEWATWALIDISCRRVYAFKVILKEGRKVEEPKRRLGCVGYVLCPHYGETVQGKTRPVSYATEVVKLPKLEPYTEEVEPQDDDVDELPPIPPRPALNGVNGGSGNHPGGGMPMVVPAELNNRLASIDANLTRIADALELLVVSLGPARRRE